MGCNRTYSSRVNGIVHDGRPPLEDGDVNEAEVAVQRVVKVGEGGDPRVAAGGALRPVVDHGRVERLPLRVHALAAGETKRGERTRK